MFTLNSIRYNFFDINPCGWAAQNNCLHPGSLATAQVTISIGCEISRSYRRSQNTLIRTQNTCFSIIDFVYLLGRHGFIGRKQDVYSSATDSCKHGGQSRIARWHGKTRNIRPMEERRNDAQSIDVVEDVVRYGHFHVSWRNSDANSV